MKHLRVLSVLILVSCHSLLIAQQKVKITGKIENPLSRQISVTYASSDLFGQEIIIEDQLADDNTFSLEFELDKPVEAVFSDGNEYTSIYIEPGDDMYLTLNTKNFDESLKYTGEGSVHNNYLAATFLQFEDPENPEITDPEHKVEDLSVDEYLKLLDSTKAKQEKLLEEHKYEFSPVFKVYANNKITYTDAALRLKYPMLYERANGEKPDLPNNYYDFLKNINKAKSFHYITEAHADFLKMYIIKLFTEQADENEPDHRQTIRLYNLAKENLTDRAKDYILTIIMLTAAEDYHPDFEPLFYEYLENATIDLYKKEVEKAHKTVLATAQGALAPDFTLDTHKGKAVRLSDFKGKVVYLDFWASWCRPCLSEIPDAKKLKEKYKRKDVVFLYVSLDDSEDDWRDAIDRFDLDGYHMRDTKDDIGQLYNIRAIPTFILINKEGKISMNPAPRPSNKDEVEKAIDDLLKQ